LARAAERRREKREEREEGENEKKGSRKLANNQFSFPLSSFLSSLPTLALPTMETASPPERPPTLPEERPTSSSSTAEPEGASGNGSEKVDGCMPLTKHVHRQLHQLLLPLLLLATTQLLSALGLALRWLGLALEGVAGERKRERGRERERKR
jgi:hypothetical protein